LEHLGASESVDIALKEHRLLWQCGTNIGAAREKVRVARALPELPKISASFREGRISYSKVRAMTRVATPKNEKFLLGIALHGTAAHVEAVVRNYRRGMRLEAIEKDNNRHAHRELSWYMDSDGMWIIKARFTAEQFVLIKKAFEAAMNDLFEEQRNEPEDVSAETPPGIDPMTSKPYPIAILRADALERVAETFLSGTAGERSGGDRYLINIHTETDVLNSDGEAAESECEDGGNVSAETSRRMACDASVVKRSLASLLPPTTEGGRARRHNICARPLWYRSLRSTYPTGVGGSPAAPWHEGIDGEPLNIGRKSRTIPPAIRRAVKRRDHSCRFPGCTCCRFVDAHHIHHWADGGETSMENLVLLCRRHHRLVHEGGFGVLRQADGEIRFHYPDGRVLPTAPDGRFRGNADSIRVENNHNGLDITPKTLPPMWHGEQMDHDLAQLAMHSLD
jgi:hypothetical protein